MTKQVTRTNLVFTGVPTQPGPNSAASAKRSFDLFILSLFVAGVNLQDLEKELCPLCCVVKVDIRRCGCADLHSTSSPRSTPGSGTEERVGEKI